MPRSLHWKFLRGELLKTVHEICFPTVFLVAFKGIHDGVSRLLDFYCYMFVFTHGTFCILVQNLLSVYKCKFAHN